MRTPPQPQPPSFQSSSRLGASSRNGWKLIVVVALHVALGSPAWAAATAEADLRELRLQLAELKAEQSRTNQRIREMETVLGTASESPPHPAMQAQASAQADTPVSNLRMSGDFRLRYENNHGDEDRVDRHRGVLRARLRASYQLSEHVALGAQLATGDPDDPNTTDVTLSNFNDDLQVSLDQVYVTGNWGDWRVLAGRIPQPFARTDLVWDGDVSPQGGAVGYQHRLDDRITLKATGGYFVIDEASAGSDSGMGGIQAGISAKLSSVLSAELTGAYYDYSLPSLAGADGGDFRSNQRNPDGSYVSDFDLVDVIAALTYQGFGERWPVRLAGDFVRNEGAADGENQGHQFDLSLGRVRLPGEWKVGYGYAEADVDAVMAAFSHDNLDLATNYVLHALTFDYVPRDRWLFNVTYYRYQPLHPVPAGVHEVDDWLNRIRCNLMVTF